MVLCVTYAQLAAAWRVWREGTWSHKLATLKANHRTDIAALHSRLGDAEDTAAEGAFVIQCRVSFAVCCWGRLLPYDYRY